MSNTNNTTEQADKPVDDVEQDLRNATTIAIKALEFWKEPTKAFMIIKKYLAEAVENDRVANDPIFAKFLYEVLAPGLARKLAKERSNDD